ncbi:NUDIX hydrolase [Chitinophaga solisilvae]|uniref:NUDIX domain-containing protein n=1 Tax=Chitinophaga solisilvae TaxID=1233460 RepID=A0A433WM27_9BACT|nr:NUDIX domain-containing protein [Chitinophaga solisilvae]NSL87676.1 NUDIX domain-containing protein [Chitinophaga solisilvae]
MKHIDCVGLIVVENRELLLAFSKNKQAWYLPGGKVDAGESPLEAIQREVMEELSLELSADQLQWYYHITAPAFGETDLRMEQDCFLCRLHEAPQPTAEIAAVRFFSRESYSREAHQVKGVLLAFERLYLDGLVD